MTKMNLILHHLYQIRNILQSVPNSRYRSTVATKLDELEMWVNANPDFHDSVPEYANEEGSASMHTDIQRYGYEGDGWW